MLTRHDVGAGRVYWGKNAVGVLADLSRPLDLDYAAPDPAFDLRFAHRRLPAGDIYFVTNQTALT